MTHYLMSDKLVLQHVLYTADAIIDGHRRALSTLLKAAMTRLKTRLTIRNIFKDTVLQTQSKVKLSLIVVNEDNEVQMWTSGHMFSLFHSPQSVVESDRLPIGDHQNLSIGHVLHAADGRVKRQCFHHLRGVPVPESEQRQHTRSEVRLGAQTC